jgi:hypothetical protein
MTLPDAETISNINMIFQLLIANLMIYQFFKIDFDLEYKKAIRLLIFQFINLLVNLVWVIYRFFGDV